MSKISSHSWHWLAIALAGPVVQGAILGLRGGPRATALLALGLPAIIAAVTALTTPTLYVGGAVLGPGRPLIEVAAATSRAARALGLALLGVAPLSLLLAATLPEARVAPAQGVVLLVVALAVGLHRLWCELRDQTERQLGAMALFAGYVGVTFILGARLFFDLIGLGLGGLS
jgi:hypothetical protein